MNRTEFLKIMRESLERNIPEAEIEENIRYYREYFEQSTRSDEEVCEELGDPRLIANSVIKAYRASKGSAAEEYTQEARREYSERQSGNPFSENEPGGTAGSFFNKLIIVLVILCVIMVLGFLFRVALAVFRVALTILLPVLLIVIIWKLVRGDI